jgi:hypothetical protein
MTKEEYMLIWSGFGGQYVSELLAVGGAALLSGYAANDAGLQLHRTKPRGS